MIEAPEGLLTFLQTEEQNGKDESINEECKVALDFYNGKPFGFEEDGRSQAVTRDVQTAVDYMTVAIVRMTAGSDRVVEFEPRRADQVQAAQDATELVAWQFMRQQSGYAIIHDWVKSGLLEKRGVAKTWVQPKFEYVEEYLPASQIDARDDIIAAEPIEDYFDVNDMGETEQVYLVKVRVEADPEFRDMAVPNEEFRVARDARSLDDAVYIGHITRKSLSDLVAMGFDAEDVQNVWDGGDSGTGLDKARDGGRDYSQDGRAGMARQVWLNEEYVRFDYNGDGVAELLCVHRVGTHILSIEEVEEQPFVIWTPFPMPHRLFGDSLADKTMDIQLSRSILTRQLFDGLYHTNAPRFWIPEEAIGSTTIDDLMTNVPGMPVRGKGPVPPVQLSRQFDVGGTMAALEYYAGEQETRTGITRMNQGIDADALNKTATGTALQQAAGHQMSEYVGRNFAGALAELFEKKLRLLKRHGRSFDVRIDGQFKQIEPSQWDEDMDMSIRVGVGSGRKEQRLAYLGDVLAMQKEAVALGSPLVDDEKLYASAKAFCTDAGLGDVNRFFNDPANSEPKQIEQQVDPALEKAKADLELQSQIAAAKLQLQRDEMEGRLSLQRDETQARLDADMEKHRLEMQQKREKADLDMQLERERNAGQMQLARERAEMEALLAVNTPDYRAGGDLDK